MDFTSTVADAIGAWSGSEILTWLYCCTACGGNISMAMILLPFGGRNQKHTPQLVCTPVLLTGWNPPRAGSVGWRWVSQISGHLMGPYGFGTHHNRHYATPFFWEEWPRMAEGHCRGRRRCQFVMVSTLMARAWKWSMERKHRPEGSWRQCTRGLGAELWQTCGAIKKHSAIQSEYWDYRDWGLQYGDPLPPLFFFFSVILLCM